MGQFGDPTSQLPNAQEVAQKELSLTKCTAAMTSSTKKGRRRDKQLHEDLDVDRESHVQLDEAQQRRCAPKHGHG